MGLKARYEALFGAEGVLPGALKEVTQALQVTLPDDFVQVSQFYSGGLVGGVSHNEIAAEGAASNVVGETLALREAVGLPERFVVLAEPPESLIVLDTAARNPKATVVWCDASDVEHLEAGDFASEPTLWASYAEFFGELLDDEEEERDV